MNSKTSIITNYFDELNRIHKINGVISIEQDKEILFRKAFGYSNLEHNIENSYKTKFLIGSNTKLFTAVSILQLIEKGLITVDTQVKDFFPEYSGNINNDVTIHHLLSHTGGFKDFSELYAFENYKVIEIDQEILLSAIFRESDYLLDNYHYSNPGYYILGIIIEKLSGLSYIEYINQNILEILGMRESGIYDQDLIIKNIAFGYKKYNSGMTLARYYEMKKWYSSAGIYSTVDDMNKWLKALATNQLLTSDSFESICTPVKNNYGYGCLIPDTEGVPYIWHNGFIKGQYSYIRFYSSQRVRMQILRNSSAHTSETPDELNTDYVCSEIARIIEI